MHSSFRLDAAYLMCASGRFDGAAAALVHDDVRLALADGAVDVTLDLSVVDEVDERAVEEIASVACSVAVRHRHLFIAPPGERMMTVTDPNVVRNRLRVGRAQP